MPIGGQGIIQALNDQTVGMLLRWRQGSPLNPSVQAGQLAGLVKHDQTI